MACSLFSGECFGYAPWVKSIGPYRLLAELGRGGMGVVYRALDERDGRQVALKALLELDALGLERFRREATLLQDLEHPNLVRVLDVHLDPPVPYLACELVEGQTLAERVARDGPLPWEEAVRLVRQVAAGLAEAHARGLLHRDVKPANVLLAPGGPKLADFGAVKAFGQESLTQTGALVGTPSYMAPEQATGDKHRLSPRTDVYGLSATLFFALTGKPPFKGETMIDTLNAVLGSPPPRPSRWVADLPPALDALCMQGLAKDPPQRPASPLALRAALADLSQGAAPRASRYVAVAVVLACLGVGMLAGVLWGREGAASEASQASEPPNGSRRSSSRRSCSSDARRTSRGRGACTPRPSSSTPALARASPTAPSPGSARATETETWRRSSSTSRRTATGL